MSKETELKKKIGAMLGTGVLATALTAVPVSFNVGDLSLDSGVAFAKGGGGEGGNSGSGSDDSDDDSDNSGSGSSNSGSGSGNSGSGSDDSDDSGEHGGSGSDDDDDDSDSGEHGGSGSGSGSGSGRSSGRDSGRGGSSSTEVPPEFGFVVKAEVAAGHVEIGYSDGWKEEVENGRYELKSPGNRTVVERPATQADIDRLNAAARASRL